MSFAADYLVQLQAFATRSALPRIRALHLPPPRTIQDSKGEFCAVELEDGSLGLSYVLLDDTLTRLQRNRDAFGLAGADALEVAWRYANHDDVWKTLGFAAANALSRCLFDRAGFSPEESRDSLGQLDPQPGDHVGMIGLFKPLLERILASGARLTVVELKAELQGEHEGYRVTLDAAQIADCNKVVSTSTLLLNETLERMLACCRQARCFAMIGPGAGCLPDALFARGVTLIGGSWIYEGQGFTAALRQGSATSDYARKFALTATNYPGWRTLLERVLLGRRWNRRAILSGRRILHYAGHRVNPRDRTTPGEPSAGRPLVAALPLQTERRPSGIGWAKSVADPQADICLTDLRGPRPGYSGGGRRLSAFH